jgi:uncharacterized membrane protein YfcA
MDGVSIVAASTFVAAVLRGVTGLGFAVAAVPLMALAIAPTTAIVIAVFLQCLMGLRDVIYLRHMIERQSVFMLTLGALFGTPMGVWLLSLISQAGLRILISFLIIVGLLAVTDRVRFAANSKTAFGLGIMAGVFSGVAAMPGPPAIAYFLGAKMPAIKTRASLMIFFFFTSLIALPGLYLAGEVTQESMKLAMISVPPMIAGTWIGGLIFSRFGEGGYRSAVVAMMVVAAILIATKGVFDFI